MAKRWVHSGTQLRSTFVLFDDETDNMSNPQNSDVTIHHLTEKAFLDGLDLVLKDREKLIEQLKAHELDPNKQPNSETENDLKIMNLPKPRGAK